jgi:lambda family phage tail tape measure protein
VSDFRLKVIAETQAAESSLKQVDKVANEATRARNLKIEIPNYSDLSKNFRDLNKDISSAANGIKDFYKVASKLPVGPLNDINELAGQLKRVAVTATDTGRNVGDAGDVIKATFNATNKAAETLVSRLTRIALSLYVIKEAAGLVQGAFGGMFNETIGREVKLRETILKTQTTLASTNKVFKDGKEITDPYQKIVTLTGAVNKSIESIRERSIALAGVTSGEVIEVFGIVASQIGQIGGGLKEAEDLAIQFAAALGTFGLPIYQARQEIGSILRGDIGIDSILAKSLQISSKDIAEAKTKAGGVVKFLEERLAAAVAGQRIAAEGFSGVVSNIKDLSELVSQNFGAGLLDPLLDSLTKVFDFLFSIRNEMFAISKLAGESIGTVADTVLKMVGGATGGARQTQLEGGGGGGRTGVGARPVVSKVISDFGADDALNAAKATVKYVQLEFSKAFSTVYLQISTLLERVSSAFLAVGGGLAMLAKGLLSIKIETFKALIGAVESLSPALLVAAKGLGAFLALWGKFMELPLVQELAQISAGMKVLEMTGVTPLIMTGGTLFMLFKNWSKVIEFVVTQFNSLRTIIGGVIAYIGGLIAQLARAATAMLTAWSPSLKALQGLRTELLGVVTQLNNVAVSAQRAGTALSGAQQKVEGLKGGVVGMIAGFIKFQLIMFAITAAISLAMERFSAYKEAQDKIANDKRVQEAIRRLATTYKDLGENATESQKRAKAFEESLVNQDYDKAIENVEKLKKKIEELRATFEKPTGFNATLVGKELNNLLAALNPSNLDVLFDFSKPIKDGFGNAVKDAEIEKLKAAQIEASKKAREVDKIAGQANVELEAQKRVDLSKEYAELQRQQQNDLFQQRQTLAQKEVEIFRAAGELRIFQMEQANAKLIEGEEGASRTALEALNNYLSVRENGELEIEAAKKDIAIEVANLEKTIADYRFENEKKIAEIKKRSAENEKAMADAQRQAAGQAPAAPGVSEGFRVGSTGRSSGPHLDIRGSDRESVVREAASIIKAWQGQNLPYITLPNANIDVKNMTDEAALLKALRKEQVAHDTTRNRRIGQSQGAIDIAVPSGTLVPTPASAPSWAGAGGWQATSQATGNRFLHGLKDSKASPPGAAPAAAPTPALQSPDDLAPAAEAYAAAVRGVASAMERVRTLQAALTEAQTVAAFEEIAKAAFPQVQLEGYEDNLFTVQATYDAVAASAAGAFDPERAAITIDRTMKIAAANREVKQITDEIAKRPNITEKERSKLADDLAAKKKNYLADLAKEEAAKLRILAVQRATDFITQTQADTKAIYDNIEVLELRNQLRFEGVDPAVIAGAEALLLNERRMVEATKLLNEQLAIEYAERDRLQKLKATADAAALPALQKDLDDALAKIAKLEGQRAGVQATGFAQAGAINAQTAAETEPGAKIRAFIGDAKRELADLEAVAVRISQSIGDAVGNSLANGIMGLIEGTTTAKQVFADFLKSIGQILVQEGTKMIAMYIAIAIAKAIAGMGSNFTGGNSSAVPTDAAGWGSSFNTELPGITSVGKIGFAKGGAFTNSIVSSPTMFKFADGGAMRTGLMGEAGPEAIMPLKRGADGSLGVQANGLREAMDRQQGGGSGSPVLNMSFQSTNINGVEYVSREQLESAMAETRRASTRDGAKRGMTMTLDRIQNSSSTRRRAGI